MKSKRSAFLKRKSCVMKKTMELSVLCDVKACAIIVDTDGSVETWPRNSTDLNPIFDQYRKKHSLKKQSNNVAAAEVNPKNVLLKLNSKIEAVEKRIEFLKGKSITNRDDGCGKREEFSEILKEIIGSCNIQEIEQEEETIPLEYYWDGQIGFSDNGFATAINVEQPCPEAYFWDSGTGYLENLLTN